MYYRIEISSRVCDDKKVFIYREEDPKIDRDLLTQAVKKRLLHNYYVNVCPITPKLPTKILWWSEIERELRSLVFHKMAPHVVEDYVCCATFYGEKPFDVKAVEYHGKWYTFFRNPGRYTTNIWRTLTDMFPACFNGPYETKYADACFKNDKFVLSQCGHNWNLLRLIGTHIEFEKQEVII